MNATRSIDELLATVSASRLNTFHNCRLQFYFRYVLGLKAPTTAARHVGSAVHHALSLWNKARWRKQPLPALEAEFTEFWTQEPTLAQETDAKAQGWALVETYLQNTPIPPNEPAEGVEVSLECDLAGLTRLVGIIDLVRPGGRLVDFKTTGQTPNPAKAEHLHETQLSAYAVLYREATDQTESGFELHHLVKLKTPKLVVVPMPPMTETQRNRLYRSVESYLEGVRREDWVPSPNPMTCMACEFFHECRRWS